MNEAQLTRRMSVCTQLYLWQTVLLMTHTQHLPVQELWQEPEAQTKLSPV